ncbi:MAG: thermonuclease family protein [Actinobacteria bacterium]|nr:thermonuclease family protein [Actinomycetota bacterium]
MNQPAKPIFNTSGILLFVLTIFLILPPVVFFLSGCGLYYSDIEDTGITKPILEYNVIEVIDGDTFVLSNNEHVRLIGINTPESERYFYEEAKEVLKLLVLNKNVRLEKDVEDKDAYGRLLRYVYLGNLFINLEMVKRGFANVFTFPPNIKYTDKFIEAEREARKKEIGLWEKSNSSNIEISINYDAEGDDRLNLNGEYIIFKNNNDYNINLAGWTVKDLSANIYDFGKMIFKSGSSLILFSGNGNDLENKFYWNSSKPIWNNDHDALYLRDKDGLLVELYNY